MTIDDKKGGDISIPLSSGEIKITGYAPTVWITANLARSWFNDAINEARAGSRQNERRREIVFSVAFAESYLLEWVRDSILKSDFEKLKLYFPPDRRRGVKEKWKEIPKKLKQDGLLLETPDLSGRFWFDWTTLVEYRDGLLHARASRPLTSGQPKYEKPVPDGVTLSQIEPGWPIRVTVTMIEEFHREAKIVVPDWLHVKRAT